MSLNFKIGDVVDWEEQKNDILLEKCTITAINIFNIATIESPEGCIHQISIKHLKHTKKMFSVYHHHKHGSTQWVVMSSVFPTEEQVVEGLEIDFEPEIDEFIAIEEIEQIEVLELS